MLTYDLEVETTWESVFSDLTHLLDTIMTAITEALPPDLQASHLHFDLSLSNDCYIRELNREWRGKDMPTNVLSFPLHPSFIEMDDLEKDLLLRQQPLWLGDVVVSLDTLEREARLEKKNVAHHFCHLLIHGILHLLGYDHENDEEAEKMEQLEITILEKLGICDPYA